MYLNKLAYLHLIAVLVNGSSRSKSHGQGYLLNLITKILKNVCEWIHF